MSSTAEVAREWMERVWNKRDRQRLREILHPETQGQVEGRYIKGQDDFIASMYDPFIAAFPDLHIEVRGIVAQGDEVVIRWTASGTHHGPFGPVPASGVGVQFRGMTWQRYQDGRLLEGEDSWDMHALIQALQTGESVGSTQVVQAS